jgi:ABC-type sugar transport system substrate-binding protein
MTSFTIGRKALVTLLSGSVLVGMVACGSDSKSSTTTAAPQATTAPVESAAPEVTTAPVESAAPEVTTAPASTAPAAAAGEIAEAKQLLDALLVKPTELQTTEKIGKEVPTGKTIDWIVCGVPECTALTQPLTDAAAALGWTVKPIDGGLSPETVLAAWNLAVQNKPDAVVATGFPSVMFADPLAKLQAAGIPVVQGYVTEDADPAKGIIAVIAGGGDTFQNQGKYEADFVLGRIGDKANTVFLGGSTFPGIDAVIEGYKAEYSRLCAGCKFDSLDIAGDTIGTTLPTNVVAYLTSHPDVNYIVLGIGSMVLGLPDALKAANLDVKIVGTAPSATTAQMVKDGDIDGIIMLQQGDSMWQMVDALARHFAGVDVAPSMKPSPAWAVVKENIDQITGDPYVLIADYQAQYKALWGK